MESDHIWQIRNPDGAAMGLEYARARMAPHDEVLAHALPERADVEVFDISGLLVARGRDLSGDLVSPMARLRLEGPAVQRENMWPEDSDLGKPVILPGGEVGILKAWWHAEDHSEWTWTVEFHNHA